MLVSMSPHSISLAEKALTSHDGLAAKCSEILLCAAKEDSLERVSQKTGWPMDAIEHVLTRYTSKGDNILIPRPTRKKPLIKNDIFTTYEGAEWYYYKGGLLISGYENIQAVLKIIKSKYPDTKGKSALDIGAGEGAASMMLKDEGFDVEATDIGDSEFVFKNIPFKYLDADKGLTGSLKGRQYDLIIAISVIQSLYQPYLLIEDVFKLLRPGGWFIMTTNNITSFLSRAWFATEGTFVNYAKKDLDVNFHISIMPLAWFTFERLFRKIGFSNVSTQQTTRISVICFQSWKHIFHSIVRVFMYVLSLKTRSEFTWGHEIMVVGKKP